MASKVRDGLYHKDIRLPKVSFQYVDVVLNYTYHAVEAAESDRYGLITLPETVNFGLVELVEMEVVNGKPFKVVVRQHYNQSTDLVLVILLDGYRVKTVWLNSKRDQHQTLDRSKYIK